MKKYTLSILLFLILSSCSKNGDNINADSGFVQTGWIKSLVVNESDKECTKTFIYNSEGKVVRIDNEYNAEYSTSNSTYEYTYNYNESVDIYIAYANGSSSDYHIALNDNSIYILSGSSVTTTHYGYYNDGKLLNAFRISNASSGASTYYYYAEWLDDNMIKISVTDYEYDKSLLNNTNIDLNMFIMYYHHLSVGGYILYPHIFGYMQHIDGMHSKNMIAAVSSSEITYEVDSNNRITLIKWLNDNNEFDSIAVSYH